MRAGGRGGCNSWFAQAEVNDQRLIFSAVAATRMACVSDDITRQEDGFFAALAATRFWRLEQDHLLLVDGAGVELASLAKSRF
jgi:putative lipoprotein